MKAAIYNYKVWIAETQPEVLKKVFDEILEQATFNVLSYVEHRFSPQGFTAVWLLSESHLAIHTFPEESCTYIELSSCAADKNALFSKILEQIYLPLPRQ